MNFKSKLIDLKNGKTCSLVPTDPDMASSMIKYRKRMTGETYYSVFYPYGKGGCLELFYAGKIADKIFMVIGTVITIIMVVRVYVPIG